MRIPRRIKPVLIAGLATLAVMSPSAIVSAQSSPSNQSASVVQGSCAALGTSLHDLKSATPNDPSVGGSFSGATTATGVLTSETDIRTSLKTLLSSPHAIVVGDLAAPVACGDIGGFTRGIVNNDDIEIGLSPVGDSQIFGLAKLEGDGDETEIDLYVVAPFGS